MVLTYPAPNLPRTGNQSQLVAKVGDVTGLFSLKFPATGKCLAVYFTPGPAQFVSLSFMISSLRQLAVKAVACTTDSSSGSFQLFSTNASGQLQSTAQVFPPSGAPTSVCLGAAAASGGGALLAATGCSTSVFTNRFALVNPSTW